MVVTIYLLRHEKRYSHGLYDCSLTNEGMSALLAYNHHDNYKNIYCSPLLRTIQTIYPYAKKTNKLIKLENSLYEFVAHNTSHYSQWKELPKVILNNNLNFFCNQYKLFRRIYKNLKDNSLSEMLYLPSPYPEKCLQDDLYMLANMFTLLNQYENIENMLENISYCALMQDVYMKGKYPDNKVLHDHKDTSFFEKNTKYI